ncbi:CHAT domain protein [Ceratobasidium sp. AG-Ba]|nr:CHAT domain protein [Ceratobasidium sp. AG-Ba]QRW10512.1 CHAT domain protein [Ceratobasidium sp. AG-Ba]
MSTLAGEIQNNSHNNNPNESERLPQRAQDNQNIASFLQSISSSLHEQEQTALQTSDTDPAKLDILITLGNSYNMLYKHTGALHHLRNVARCFEEAVLLDIEDEAILIECLDNVAIAYQSLFEALREQKYIEKAIGYLNRAISLMQDTNSEIPQRLNDLGDAYESLSKYFGRQDSISKAIECYERALPLISNSNQAKAICLSNLGIVYFQLFKNQGIREHAEVATRHLELAVSLTPDGHPGKAASLTNLGNAYESLFEHFGVQNFIEKAIVCKQQAVSITPGDHPERAAFLNNLGNSYQAHFERLGVLKYIDQAIICKEQAVSMTLDGDPRKPGRLSNLGNAYRLSFDRSDILDHIEKSLKYNQMAVYLTPDNDVQRASRLVNLGTTYQILFKRLGDQEHLKQAILCGEEAVSLTSDNHTEKPMYLNNLGAVYQSSYSSLGQKDDIFRAINCYESVLLLTPDNHLDRPRRISNLGTAYQMLYESEGSQESLEKTLRYKELAVSLTPESHKYKTLFLNNLSNTLWVAYERLGLLEYGQKSIEMSKCAALSISGHPLARLNAGRNWAQRSAILGLPPLEAYTQCMHLLPRIVWLGVSVHDRFESITPDVRELISEAGAAALSAKRYDLALEWLEQGRCFIWSQLLQLRTPLEKLSCTYPGLALELREISNRLDQDSISQSETTRRAGGLSTLHDAAEMHHRWAEKREEIIDNIRALPEFEDFLLPAKANKLLRCVHGRTLVVLNTNRLGFGALIIKANASKIDYIPLGAHNYQAMEQAYQDLESCIQDEGLRRPVWAPSDPPANSFRRIMAIIWYDVVQPVLSHLEISRVLPPDDLPHITWCLAGSLSGLPVHAAGDYDDPCKILFNLAVSSYIPNIGYLERPYSAPNAFTGMLTVSHASAMNGMSYLPGAQAETVQLITKFDGFKCTQMQEDDATSEAVLAAMADHSWVHFACHASQNRTDPLKSAFHLHDKDLDLATIYKSSLENVQFAFLSACQTASGDSSLPDEVTHLAAGLLMVGYSSVIATMWSISDAHAPLIAEKVYEHMVNGAPDYRKAPLALHKALSDLRNQNGADNFAQWVPYIHIGHCPVVPTRRHNRWTVFTSLLAFLLIFAAAALCWMYSSIDTHMILRVWTTIAY